MIRAKSISLYFKCTTKCLNKKFIKPSSIKIYLKLSHWSRIYLYMQIYILYFLESKIFPFPLLTYWWNDRWVTKTICTLSKYILSLNSMMMWLIMMMLLLLLLFCCSCSTFAADKTGIATTRRNSWRIAPHWPFT